MTHGDKTGIRKARQHLEHSADGSSEAIFWNTKCISLVRFSGRDIFHTVYLSMIMHLMDCIISFLEQHFNIDKFNQLF
jgi:hypothetical protein